MICETIARHSASLDRSSHSKPGVPTVPPELDAEPLVPVALAPEPSLSAQAGPTPQMPSNTIQRLMRPC